VAPPPPARGAPAPSPARRRRGPGGASAEAAARPKRAVAGPAGAGARAPPPPPSSGRRPSGWGAAGVDLRRHRRAVTAAAAAPPPPPPPLPPPPAAGRPSGGRRRAASAATAAARSGWVRVRRGDSRVGGEDSAGTGGRVVAAPARCGAIGGADARCREMASLGEAAHSSLTIKIPCRVPSGNVQNYLSILASCCRPAVGRIRCRLAHLLHTSLGDRTPTHCGLWPCRELSPLESVRGAVATNQPSSGRLLCSRLGLRDIVCALG